jgi:hypothetical protein
MLTKPFPDLTLAELAHRLICGLAPDLSISLLFYLSSELVHCLAFDLVQYFIYNRLHYIPHKKRYSIFYYTVPHLSSSDKKISRGLGVLALIPYRIHADKYTLQ